MTVVRAEGATRGSCDSPVVQSGVEALVDVTLVQKAGGCGRAVSPSPPHRVFAPGLALSAKQCYDVE